MSEATRVELVGDTKEEIQVSSVSVLDNIKALEVETDDDFDFIEAIIISAKEQKKKVEKILTPHCEQAHATWKGLVAERKQHTEPLDEIINIGKRKNGTYRAQLRAEQARMEAVALAQAKQDDEEEKLATAEYFEKRGDHASANAVLEQAETAPVVAVKVPSILNKKSKGTRERISWKFRITDPSKVPDQFKVIDEKAIGALVRAQKGNCNIAGVDVYTETTCG